ncbi:hypothetical protein [Paraburkholderia sp. RL17-337-BIB-A]|uniref:hypothetical protein n=1 Tax=Paraburkholderia sp. RL17-337-BIB-A TaxID=3031636 RepID=UPI0038B99CF6
MGGEREQINQAFLENIQGRTSSAILTYFFSHGVCVGRSDLRTATRLPEHAHVFSALEPEFARLMESINLLEDIGFLSLPDKEKTMRAIYRIEARLAEQRGDVQGLGIAVARIGRAKASIPRKPKLWPYAVWGSVVALGGFVNLHCVLIGVAIYVIGAAKFYQFVKHRAQADQEVRDASAQFEQMAVPGVAPPDSLNRAQ